MFSEYAQIIPKTEGLSCSCQGPEKSVASQSCLFLMCLSSFLRGDRKTAILGF